MTDDNALERRLDRLGIRRDDDWVDRYLLCNHLVDPQLASSRKRFEAVARFCRDLLAHRWVKTRRAREAANPKRVYYLSMEFLIGRTLVNNIINLGVEQFVRDDLQRPRHGLDGSRSKTEPDAGLGNGGLGRLAACFIDSLATLQIPAMGYGLRYEYGIFRQAIDNGFQVEQPDHWLAQPDPWEVARPGEAVAGAARLLLRAGERRSASVPGQPLDAARRALRPPGRRLRRPDDQHAAAVGSGVARVLRLRRVQLGRLRRRRDPERRGRDRHARAVPRRFHGAGQALRFVQEYFLVCCSLADIVARFRRTTTTGRRCPTRWPSSSTTRIRRWPWPS